MSNPFYQDPDDFARDLRLVIEAARANRVIETVRYCASCGEREGSEYAKHCCTDDNMIED